MSIPNTESLIANKISIEFNKIAKDVTSCYVAVGMITNRMFDFANRNLPNCRDWRIICGVHMATTPEVMIKLKSMTEEGKIQAKVFTRRFFHSKLYLFKVSGNWLAYVGSGNFTNGGWSENEELFVKVSEPALCDALIQKFKHWEVEAEDITERFINIYTQSFTSGEYLEKEKRKNISDMLDKLASKFNIDNINFTGQFFQKQDVLAFAPGKTHLDTPEIHQERRLVRQKLFQLNDLLANRIPSSWNLVPHYQPDHIVSHIETKNHHDYNVRSLWVGYGRSEAALKKYDKYREINNTPLFFMRMQVIVSYDKLGVWLMPGKIHAGQIDREYFLSRLKDNLFAQKFFELLTGLGTPYWIEVADDHQLVTKFQTMAELKEYVEKDNWRHYYFILGRDYDLDDPAISTSNIVQTCLDNFSKYYPLYEMTRDKTFD